MFGKQPWELWMRQQTQCQPVMGQGSAMILHEIICGNLYERLQGPIDNHQAGQDCTDGYSLDFNPTDVLQVSINPCLLF